MVGERVGALRTETGVVALTADRAISDVDRLDVLLVPGGGPGIQAVMANATVLEWIRHIHQQTRWTTSVCTGALILGSAGLLKGLPATAYWASRPYLEQFDATYTPGRFVEAGKIITAAGVSAGQDMALHLASRLAGDAVAQALQLAVEYDPQPPFDTGSPEKAGPQLQKLALRLVEEALG